MSGYDVALSEFRASQSRQAVEAAESLDAVAWAAPAGASGVIVAADEEIPETIGRICGDFGLTETARVSEHGGYTYRLMPAPDAEAVADA